MRGIRQYRRERREDKMSDKVRKEKDRKLSPDRVGLSVSMEPLRPTHVSVCARSQLGRACMYWCKSIVSHVHGRRVQTVT
jgi:hypothetical protein